MNFKPMLAETVDLERLYFPKYVQPKFDGIRCIVLPILGPVSRTLKPIPNNYVRNTLSNDNYLYHDGEIVTYTDGKPDDLYIVQSKVMSSTGKFDFQFHTFDHVRYPSHPYRDRHGYISFGRITTNLLVNNITDLFSFEAQLVRLGWEGIIIRGLDAPYKYGRSTIKEGYLLKMKRFQDSEARIVGFVEKLHNTNEQTRDERGYAKRSSAKHGMVPSGTLGAIQVVWSNGIRFEIGSGFDDTQRAQVWAQQDLHMNRLVTFKYHRTGPNGAPLIPIFKCFRADV